jgi:hypothetical protein
MLLLFFLLFLYPLDEIPAPLSFRFSLHSPLHHKSTLQLHDPWTDCQPTLMIVSVQRRATYLCRRGKRKSPFVTFSPTSLVSSSKHTRPPGH